MTYTIAFAIINTSKRNTQSDELAELNKTLRQAMLVAWQQDTHLMTVLTSCHCEFISNPRQQKATRRSNHSGFTQQGVKTV